MLSPLLNNTPALPDGPSAYAAEKPPSLLQTGRFAHLLFSNIENSTGCGEPLPKTDFLKKSSSGSSFPAFALISLLQGMMKDPLEAGMKEAGEDEPPQGMLCPENLGLISDPLSLTGEFSSFTNISVVSTAASFELEAKDAMNAVLHSVELTREKEKTAEEGGRTPVAPPCKSKIMSTEGGENDDMPPNGFLPASGAHLSSRYSGGEGNLFPVNEAHIRTETSALVLGYEAMPGQEKLFVTVPNSSAARGEDEIFVPHKTIFKAAEFPEGKNIAVDPSLPSMIRKKEIPIAPLKDVDEKKECEAANFLETGENKNRIAGNLGNRGQNHTTFGEEEEKTSLSAEKNPPALKNQGQDTNRKPLEFPPVDREGRKEPQSVRTRDGDSPFSSFLRSAGSAEVKARPSLSSGGEVPLSGRNGEALGEGMTNVVRFLRRDGLHRASIVVEPPALGRVEIELSATAGGVEASIRVGSEQLRQLVQDQLIVLRNTLSQQGVQMTSCTVDIGDSRMDQRKEKNEGERERAHIPRQQQGEESLSFRVDLEQGLLYWMA